MAKHCQQPTVRLDVHAGVLQRLQAFLRFGASRRAHCPALSPPEHGAGGQQKRKGKRMSNAREHQQRRHAHGLRVLVRNNNKALPGGDGSYSVVLPESGTHPDHGPHFYYGPPGGRRHESAEDGDTHRGHVCADHGVGVRPSCRPCAVRGAARASSAVPLGSSAVPLLLGTCGI